jgi:hypothetical protein
MNATVTYVLAMIAAIVGAAIGWFATGALAGWIAGALGMSDFEGQRGMFAFFVVGPVGGVLGMVLSAWFVLRMRAGRPSFWRTLPRLALVLVGIVLLVRAGIWVRLHTLDTYTNAAPPTLEFEIRVPRAMAAADPSAVRVELHTDRNVGEGHLADRWVPDDGDHAVVTGSVELSLKTVSRLLVVTFPDQPARLFSLPLARDPPANPVASAWQSPTRIAVAGEEAARAAPPGDAVEMRYRVQRAGDD